MESIEKAEKALAYRLEYMKTLIDKHSSALRKLAEYCNFAASKRLSKSGTLISLVKVVADSQAQIDECNVEIALLKSILE